MSEVFYYWPYQPSYHQKLSGLFFAFQQGTLQCCCRHLSYQSSILWTLWGPQNVFNQLFEAFYEILILHLLWMQGIQHDFTMKSSFSLWCIRLSNALVFPDSKPPTISIRYECLVFAASMGCTLVYILL